MAISLASGRIVTVRTPGDRHPWTATSGARETAGRNYPRRGRRRSDNSPAIVP
jgi:hypothetical protein